MRSVAIALWITLCVLACGCCGAAVLGTPDPQTSIPAPSYSPSAPATTEPLELNPPDPDPHAGKCHVDGYTKKDGTRVDGYWRDC